MSMSCPFGLGDVVAGLAVTNDAGIHWEASSSYDFVVNILTASCDIMCDCALEIRCGIRFGVGCTSTRGSLGILFQFGAVVSIITGSFMPGLMRLHLLFTIVCGLLIGWVAPGVFALVVRWWVRGLDCRMVGLVGDVVVVTCGVTTL